MFWLSSFWLSSKSSQSLRLLGQLFLCIHVDQHWIFHKKITVAQPPELLRPFLGAGKMIKLRQIRQDPEIVAKKLDFVFFSIYFRFVFVFSLFDCFFRFCFRFLSVFLVFESNLTKSKNCKKTRVFFRCFRFFFELFSNRKGVLNWFSNYVRIPKTSLKLFSKYFRIKNDFLNYFRTWSTFWFCFPHYQCDCHSDLGDSGKICCNKLKVMFWEHSVTMEN